MMICSYLAWMSDMASHMVLMECWISSLSEAQLERSPAHQQAAQHMATAAMPVPAPVSVLQNSFSCIVSTW